MAAVPCELQWLQELASNNGCGALSTAVVAGACIGER